MAKNMTGSRASQHLPTLHKNSTAYVTNDEKADLFASHYSSVSSSSNYDKPFLRHKTLMESLWEKYPPKEKINSISDALNDPFSLHELCASINQTKNHSAPGQDGISYEIIKHLPKIAQKALLSIYNSFYLSNKIPVEWNTAIVIPILKQGENPSDPASYRPISLTSALCKIMERLLANRLYWYLESNNLLNPAQTGFRRNKNTIDQLIRLHKDVNKAIANKSNTLAVFLDFSKAFDMVWIPGLLYKLRQLGITGYAYNFINNFLTNRTLAVRIGTSVSNLYKLENGTPQGSILSPLLFIIMINDFPTLNDPSVKTSLYADDSAIWRTSRNQHYLYTRMQDSLDNIVSWCTTW